MALIDAFPSTDGSHTHQISQIEGLSAKLAGYVHDQTIPAGMWRCVHNLGKYPSMPHVEDTGGNDWEPANMIYIDLNTVDLYFMVNGEPASFAGKAYFS